MIIKNLGLGLNDLYLFILDLDGEGVYEESLCKICWDSPIECVILECGHMACCINCGKQMNECPICRQYVVRVVRFFKA